MLSGICHPVLFLVAFRNQIRTWETKGQEKSINYTTYPQHIHFKEAISNTSSVRWVAHIIQEDSEIWIHWKYTKFQDIRVTYLYPKPMSSLCPYVPWVCPLPANWWICFGFDLSSISMSLWSASGWWLLPPATSAAELKWSQYTTWNFQHYNIKLSQTFKVEEVNSMLNYIDSKVRKKERKKSSNFWKFKKVEYQRAPNIAGTNFGRFNHSSYC